MIRFMFGSDPFSFASMICRGSTYALYQPFSINNEMVGRHFTNGRGSRETILRLLLLMAAPSMVQDAQRESGIRSGPRESERPLSAQQAIVLCQTCGAKRGQESKAGTALRVLCTFDS